jgi:hypothetical protein
LKLYLGEADGKRLKEERMRRESSKEKQTNKPRKRRRDQSTEVEHI